MIFCNLSWFKYDYYDIWKKFLPPILLWECKIHSSNISHDTVKHEIMWKISKSNNINEVLQTYVMIFNDYVYESV
jgi:hypothetical protein